MYAESYTMGSGFAYPNPPCHSATGETHRKHPRAHPQLHLQLYHTGIFLFPHSLILAPLRHMYGTNNTGDPHGCHGIRGSICPGGLQSAL